MNPTLEENVRQYHPHKQNMLLKQSVIYEPIFFNRSEIPYDPTLANREYHMNRCGRKLTNKTKK